MADFRRNWMPYRKEIPHRFKGNPCWWNVYYMHRGHELINKLGGDFKCTFISRKTLCRSVFEKRRLIRIDSYAMKLLMQFVYTLLHAQCNLCISWYAHGNANATYRNRFICSKSHIFSSSSQAASTDYVGFGFESSSESVVDGVTMNNCCFWIGIHKQMALLPSMWESGFGSIFFFHSFGVVFCLFQFNPTGVGGHSGHKSPWNQMNYSSKNRTTGIWKSSPNNRRSLNNFAFQLLVFRIIPNITQLLITYCWYNQRTPSTANWFISLQIPTEKNRNSNCYFPYESGATHQKLGPTIKLLKELWCVTPVAWMLVVARFPMICVVF